MSISINYFDLLVIEDMTNEIVLYSIYTLQPNIGRSHSACTLERNKKKTEWRDNITHNKD
jgi:hypothetical protein